MKAGFPGEGIRERAYRLWEADGRCHGSGDYYWFLAVDLLEEESALSGVIADSLTRHSRSKATKATTTNKPVLEASKKREPLAAKA